MYHLALIPDAIYCASKLPTDTELSTTTPTNAETSSEDIPQITLNGKENGITSLNGTGDHALQNGIHTEKQETKLESISEEEEVNLKEKQEDEQVKEAEKPVSEVHTSAEKLIPSPLVANLVALWNKVASDLSSVTLSPAEILEGARFLLTLPPATLGVVSEASKDDIQVLN